MLGNCAGYTASQPDPAAVVCVVLSGNVTPLLTRLTGTIGYSRLLSAWISAWSSRMAAKATATSFS